jgi:hypothetical protein
VSAPETYLERTITGDPSAARVGHEQAGSVRSEISCPSARKAVRFYARRIAEHRAKMGAAVPRGRGSTGGARISDLPGRCPRYLARVYRAKAYAWRLRYEAWREYHYAYRSWMPAFWRAIAVCESGQNPPNWNHDSGTYVSTFGIIRSEYDADAAYFGAPPWRVRHSPRDQYRAARGHQARFGLGGWGCYTHGGYLVHLGRV